MAYIGTAWILCTSHCRAENMEVAFCRSYQVKWKVCLTGTQEGRFMPARMAVIVVRYAWLGAYINVQIFLHGDPPPSRCMVHFRLIYGLYCILWAFSGSVCVLANSCSHAYIYLKIFLMRLNIIFGREKRVMSLYILLWGVSNGITTVILRNHLNNTFYA